MSKYKLIGCSILLVGLVIGMVVACRIIWDNTLSGSSMRWKDLQTFKQEMQSRFPLGTHHKKVSDWLETERHSTWGSYDFDENTQLGQINAVIYNGTGDPALYGNDLMEVEFTFDKSGAIIGYEFDHNPNGTWRTGRRF
jgi:hypothetical protein